MFVKLGDFVDSRSLKDFEIFKNIVDLGNSSKFEDSREFDSEV